LISNYRRLQRELTREIQESEHEWRTDRLMQELQALDGQLMSALEENE